MTNDELIETLMARAGRLEAALYVAKAYIKDLEAHEGAEGFSTSTHELHALYCAVLKEVNQTNVQATPEKRVCEICDIHSPREGASN